MCNSVYICISTYRKREIERERERDKEREREKTHGHCHCNTPAHKMWKASLIRKEHLPIWPDLFSMVQGSPQVVALGDNLVLHAPRNRMLPKQAGVQTAYRKKDFLLELFLEKIGNLTCNAHEHRDGIVLKLPVP